ncbi:MAG: phosphoribosylanthranilate isomerase [Phycisphaerales bacterium]|jgi:phosphoribosylanthranilate isomerase|nr:phosphoribosylanthranilate isomerase [Phycisphaerales bacterium]
MTYSFLNTSTPSVKICGLTTEESVDVSVGAGADAIGFVFVQSSPRVIRRALANRLLTQLPGDVLPIAVLQDYGDLNDFSDWPGWLQLCGNEDKDCIESSPRPVIKAVQWTQGVVATWGACTLMEAILVDGSTGGLGTMAPIEELTTAMSAFSTPVIVAGGLHAGNVQEVIRATQPNAVDVSSGVESSRGVKDPELICSFIEAVKETSLQ